MDEKAFEIPAISCAHCVNTIEMELNEMAGVFSVKGDPQTRVIRVKYAIPASEDSIQALLVEIGFPPKE